MKPRVFLSHSKKDKSFIEELSNKLRTARIDVWYDEWEIPPGESIRRKIFEEGIPNCDVFFVYLTEHSIDSYWVSKELDAMAVAEAQNRRSQMALFVSGAPVRDRLALDLRAMNIPEFNDVEFISPFSKLLSRIWEVHSLKVVEKTQLASENQILLLENKNLTLENRILELQQNNSVDVHKIDQRLSSKMLTSNGQTKSCKELFGATKLKLADGTTEYPLQRIVAKEFEIDFQFNLEFSHQLNFQFSDFMGELIILGLIDLKKPSKEYHQLYYLSEIGRHYSNST